MAFEDQFPEFVYESYAVPIYGHCLANNVDIIAHGYTTEDNQKRPKNNYDIYMVTDFDKNTNLIDSAVLYTCAEAQKSALPFIISDNFWAQYNFDRC